VEPFVSAFSKMRIGARIDAGSLGVGRVVIGVTCWFIPCWILVARVCGRVAKHVVDRLNVGVSWDFPQISDVVMIFNSTQAPSCLRFEIAVGEELMRRSLLSAASPYYIALASDHDLSCQQYFPPPPLPYRMNLDG
jgi:hypothetical protein